MNSADFLVFDGSRGATVPDGLVDDARRARATLERGDGPGGDLTGWLDLPTRIEEPEIARLEAAAAEIRAGDGLVENAGIIALPAGFVKISQCQYSISCKLAP